MPKKGKGKAAEKKPLPPEIAEAIATLGDGGQADKAAQAAATIADACYDGDVVRMDIAAAGAIAPLVALLGGTTGQREAATRALSMLSVNNPMHWAYDNPAAIVQAGGVPQLVAVLRDEASTDDYKELAIRCLCNLATCTAHRTSIAQAGAIPLLLEMVQTAGDGIACAAAFALGTIAFSHSENRTRLVRAKAAGDFRDLLSRPNLTGEQKQMVEYATRNLQPPPPPPPPELPTAATEEAPSPGKKKK